MRKKSEKQKVNEEFVKTYDDSKYPKPSVTADIVIFGMFDKEEIKEERNKLTEFLKNEELKKAEKALDAYFKLLAEAVNEERGMNE